MPSKPQTTRTAERSVAIRLSATADVLIVLLFAAVGRGFHGEGNPVLGVLLTAWPFLVGLAVGWLAVRAWRRPTALWPTAIGVWALSWSVGMALRALTGGGTAVAFMIVAAAFLGALLLGYRAVVMLISRLRKPSLG